MKKYPSLRVLFDRKKQSGQNKPGTVEIEVLYKRKRKWFSTNVRILPSEWNGKDKSWIKVRNDAGTLNLKIQTMESSINKFIQKLMIEDKEFTWEGLSSFMKTNGNKETFLEFMERTLKERKDLRPNTRKNHNALQNSLKKFGKIVSFEDLTLNKIKEYDSWLHEQSLLQTSIATRHKALKIYITEALRQERLQKNPYTFFKIEHGKPALRKYLTPEELSKIENATMRTQSLSRVKDLFLFQCYTGIAYADLLKFDFKKIIEKDGKYIIHDMRQKTGEDYYIVLMPKALEILKKYNYNLPLLTNQQYNMRLKIVADTSELDKQLTSHMGRHTYASLALNAGVSIETLAKMMGHSDIKTTQIYAKMFNKTVEDAFDLLEKKYELT